MIKIYVDGAYASSRNQGGWAYVVLQDEVKIHSHFLPVQKTTNNRMEMQAAIEACKWAIANNIKQLEIISDSMYVIGTMTLSWKRNKNIDLWNELDELVQNLKIQWTHVKGHTGDKYNELCDALAVEATKTIL